MILCSINGCGKKSRARGWCINHWTRWQRRGDPLIVFTNKDVSPKYSSLEIYLYCSFIKNKKTNCWEWNRSIDSGGYGSAWWNKKHHRAHRLFYEFYFGGIPSNLKVCHKCDNRKCINPSHLFLGTSLDNNQDRKNKKRNADTRGEKNPFSKLKDKDVIEIKRLIKEKRKGRHIANIFKISEFLVSSIKLGKSWGHIS